MGAAGRVVTGFSYPVVGRYNNTGGAVSYSGGMVLARGVSVSLDLEVSDDNNFYADNVVSETDGGRFTGGTAKLTVDGLNPEADRFVHGKGEPVEVSYGESQKVEVTQDSTAAAAPYLGIGYIVRYRSGGQDIFVPTILTKAKFAVHDGEAATQEENIEWQTSELSASLARDDSTAASWRWICEDQTTEAAAKAILNGILNVSTTTPGGGG